MTNKEPKVHHAIIVEATESDNTTWVYVDCDPNEQFVNEVVATQRWDGVTCKNCLRGKPALTEQEKGR